MELSPQAPFDGGARAKYLDGLRGVAALAVVVDHFLSAFTPRLAGAELSPLLDGDLAVFIFFVLSGYVMSASSEHRHEPFILRAVKRYARLALPMLVAALVAWVLIASFSDAAPMLAAATGSGWVAAHYNKTLPSIVIALKEPLITIFLGADSYLDPPMWTMAPELMGSLAVFAVFGFVSERWRIGVTVMLALLGAALQAYWLVSFSIGAAFWILRVRDFRLQNFIGASLMMAAYLIGISVPRLLDRAHIHGQAVLSVLCAAVIVGGLLGSSSAQKVFAQRFVRFLGRVSFGLYLIHVPILLTGFAALYVFWMPSGVSMAIFIALYVMVSLVVAFLLTKFVDEPVLRLLRRLDFGNVKAAAH